MNLLDQLTDDEKARLRLLRGLREGAYAAFGRACEKHEAAVNRERGAAQEKEIAQIAVREIVARIMDDVDQMATAHGIRDNIELDLEQVP